MVKWGCGDNMKIAFIYNPESGSGKITLLLDWINNQFSSYNHELTFIATKKPKDAQLYAAEHKEFDMLLVAGGDGTLNEVVTGIMENEKRPIIGYIPTGTVNDVGHMLGIPTNIKKAVKMMLDKPKIREVDVTKINSHYFVYAAATGKFAKASYDVARKDKKRFGFWAYYKSGSKEIFKDYKIPVKATFDEGVFEGECALILFLNGPRVGGFKLFNMKSKLDDGLIEARFFKREPGVLFRLLGFFFSGGLYSTRKNKTIHSSKYTLEIPKDVEWNTDGELSCKGSVRLEVVPKAIKILTHPTKHKGYFSNQ